MINRLYVHNYRCLENFELVLKNRSSTLLVGGNGSGKSSVRLALELLQKIARGTARVREFVSPKDFTMGRSEVPMDFQIEAVIGGTVYAYHLAMDFPEGFKELRIREESLYVDGAPVFSRELAQITLASGQSGFQLDWHSAGLPIIYGRGPIEDFRNWLSRMLLLAPVPSLITGESSGDTLFPTVKCTNFAEWLSGLMTHSPEAYIEMDRLLKVVMPDFKAFKNLTVGTDAKSLVVQFRDGTAACQIPFADLSDGEKCFFVWATAIGSTAHCGPLFCFWDEPENYLAPSEVGHFTMDLRRTFCDGNQVLISSHSPQNIRQFAREDIFFLHRNNHMSPSTLRPMDQLEIHGCVADALTRGDVEP